MRQRAYGYDAAGNTATVTVTEPGAVTTTNTYDPLNRLITSTGTGGDANTTRTLGYDLDDRVTAIGQGSAQTTFTYNDRGQLLSSTGPSGAATDTYDDAGRPLTAADDAGTRTATYTAGWNANDMHNGAWFR